MSEHGAEGRASHKELRDAVRGRPGRRVGRGTAVLVTLLLGGGFGVAWAERSDAIRASLPSAVVEVLDRVVDSGADFVAAALPPTGDGSLSDSVRVSSRPSGARVYLGDSPLGTTPLAVTRAQASELLRIEAAGFEPYQLRLEEGASGGIEVRLRPREGARSDDVVELSGHD